MHHIVAMFHSRRRSWFDSRWWHWRFHDTLIFRITLPFCCHLYL